LQFSQQAASLETSGYTVILWRYFSGKNEDTVHEAVSLNVEPKISTPLPPDVNIGHDLETMLFTLHSQDLFPQINLNVIL